MATIMIDPTLQSLIPPLTPQEYDQLEANLRADGCHDPLIVWQERQILLDGHHRLEICERHGLDYRLQEISLLDFAAAKAWMIANQLGRRNLTPEQMSYYRGEQYNLQKQQGKRTDLTLDHTDTKSRNTAQRLADHHHVSEPTIKRDGAYATAVDTLAEMVGPEVRQALISRDLKLTQHDVKLLGTLLTASPETVQAVKAALAGPDPAPTLKAILRAYPNRPDCRYVI
jgi:ParB-like chromosome segregation protein Spo0J